MSSQADLATRYGTPPRGRRRLAITLVVLLAVVSLGWLGWAAWFHGSPAASSGQVGYQVVDDHTVTVVVDVRLDGVEEADCLVRAYSSDKATVGELAFTGVDGRQEVTVRTERRATSAENVGCRVEGQARRR
ncbi:DUF4307 domain-containing protein [Nocardioides campestrisoli]|uniref:DUF4307 domain-containing protein n=1 Tax=Nocardioides campestrisoli TaxID=2736757 RepID=UPI0015E73C3E|nr:DUF4307 domain-containing protein [Nocardioides campestrisoli]